MDLMLRMGSGVLGVFGAVSHLSPSSSSELFHGDRLLHLPGGATFLVPEAGFVLAVLPLLEFSVLASSLVPWSVGWLACADTESCLQLTRSSS